VAATANDHKAYYPGAEPIAMRWTGDVHSGRLVGVQLVGRLGSEVAKRVDIAATAIHCRLTVDQISDLDLAYTPPLGSPWDAVQSGLRPGRRPSADRPARLVLDVQAALPGQQQVAAAGCPAAHSACAVPPQQAGSPTRPGVATSAGASARTV
jgi:hypothetical protein